MHSINCLDLDPSSGKSDLESHLKNTDFFDVIKYPTAKFVITSVAEKEGKLTVTGNLTLKEITKSIDISATISSENGITTFKSEVFNIDRTDFGVTYKSKTINAKLKDKFIDDLMAISFEGKDKSGYYVIEFLHKLNKKKTQNFNILGFLFILRQILTFMKEKIHFKKIAFLFLFTAICGYSQDKNYSALSIPSELKENANVVFRNNAIEITVEAVDRMVVKTRNVITVLNKLGNVDAQIYQYYDDDTKITKLSAKIYDAFGKEIKKYNKGKFLDVSAVSGGTLYSDSRVKRIDLYACRISIHSGF